MWKTFRIYKASKIGIILIIKIIFLIKKIKEILNTLIGFKSKKHLSKNENISKIYPRTKNEIEERCTNKYT